MGSQEVILLAILENGRVTFRSLQEFVGASPKTLRKRLDEFARRRLIKEEGRKGWKRGKKLEYSLTEKGRKECLRQSIDGVNAGLKVLQKISATILAHPSRIDEFREKGREALFEIEITESMPLEERIRVLSTEMKRIYGPLTEAYKAMHKLMVQLEAPKVVRDYEFFIGFTKRGAIHMVPRATLERLGLEIG